MERWVLDGSNQGIIEKQALSNMIIENTNRHHHKRRHTLAILTNFQGCLSYLDRSRQPFPRRSHHMITSQEKRRRAAGQRHWEEWVSRQTRQYKASAVQDGNEMGIYSGGGGSDGGGGTNEATARRRQRQQQRERQAGEDQRRKKEQDEAFAAWVREKDKLVRAKKREARATSVGLCDASFSTESSFQNQRM